MMKKQIMSLALALTLLLGLSCLSSTALAAEQTVVHAANTQELTAAIENLQSNTKIELEGKDYNCFMYLDGLENITIQGTTGTRILSDDGGDEVMMFYDCKNVTLSGLTLGHDVPQEAGCSSGVINAGNTDLTIVGCDIFGCGVNGLTLYGGTTTMRDSTIRDCSDYILEVGNGTSAAFQNCVFSGNNYKNVSWADAISAYAWDADVNLTFTDCTFRNNKNATFISEDGGSENAKVNYTLNNCLFENNGWSAPVSNGAGASSGTTAPATPSEPTAPAQPVQPAGVTAAPTAASVLVDGEAVAFDAYSIDGNNYFKLRDLAYVLNATPKQFSVDWDGAANAISLTSGAAYAPVGGEMTAGSAESRTAAPTASKILLDGAEVAFTAYNIGGNNYFKLRDVGQALDFGIGWDSASKTITIETAAGYTA